MSHASVSILTAARHGLVLLCWLCSVAASAQIVKNKVLRREIHFETGRWAIPEAEQGVLQEVCDGLATRDNYKLELVGNTDSVGDYRYNIALSEKRAGAVRGFLIDHGADPQRVTLRWVAFKVPKASNATEEGKEKNRRTDVILTLIYFPVSKLEPVEHLKPGSTLDLKILFAFNSAEFGKGATQKLDSITTLLAGYPDLGFEVLGWTAISQSSQVDLSGMRAKAVYDYFLEKGIAPVRMTHKGMGGAGCHDEKTLDQCRRVEIVVTHNPYLTVAAPSEGTK